MAILFDVIKRIFIANSDKEHRFIVNQGGTSSGKTYTIMQRLLAIAMEEPRCIITVCGQDLPNLKVGAMRDLDTIISGSELLQQWVTINRSAHVYTGMNGSIIEFKSYQNAQDAKNGKRDYLFVNEANGVQYDVFWQLQIRTRKQVFIDYNPSARFWCHYQIIGRKDTRLIISDHRDNRFLSDDEHRKIEEINDPELWRVYARGLTGRVSGLILTNWDIVDELPPLSETKVQGFGMDFGFTNDPTSLVEMRLAHGDLWVDEIIHESGLTNPAIASKCKDAGLTKRNLIIADSAEPKSIQELVNLGLWVVPATKGADSIVAGLDILRRYRIHFTRRSVGIIEEAEQYRWRIDRDGKKTNTPIDAFNHGIDALRYVAGTRLSVTRQGTAKAKIQRL